MPLDATLEASPERNLIAAILDQALQDLHSRKQRPRVLPWLIDPYNYCRAYCNCLDIEHKRFVGHVRAEVAVAEAREADVAARSLA
jgi:hypothetical protein